ncbi:MAG: CAP domain-containing protein [bacterium]
MKCFRLFLAFAWLLCLCPVQGADVNPPCLELLQLINQQRTENGLQPVVYDAAMSAVAQEWAEEMARQNKMRHHHSLKSYMDQNGWRLMNENIFHSCPDFSLQLVVERWMKSSGHRKNLLMPQITLGGIGIAKSPETGYYAVFHGGAPTD